MNCRRYMISLGPGGDSAGSVLAPRTVLGERFSVPGVGHSARETARTSHTRPNHRLVSVSSSGPRFPDAVLLRSATRKGKQQNPPSIHRSSLTMQMDHHYSLVSEFAHAKICVLTHTVQCFQQFPRYRDPPESVEFRNEAPERKNQRSTGWRPGPLSSRIYRALCRKKLREWPSHSGHPDCATSRRRSTSVQ
jgi:hypothetical protein